MADPNLFAPPTPEELGNTTAPVAVAAKPATDLFAPPTAAELTSTPAPAARASKDLFAPPSQEELGNAPTTPAVPTKGGWVLPASTSQEEVSSIAAKHGVDPNELSKWVSLRGGVQAEGGIAQLPGLAVGEAGEVLGAGLPQFALKKTQTPEMQHAIDEISNLVDQRKSTLQKGGEVIGAVIGAGKLLKAAEIGATAIAGEELAPSIVRAYSALALPTSGAAAGLAHSKSGEELEDAGIGAAIGTVLPIAAKGLGSLAKKGADEAANYLLTQSTTVKKVIETRLAEKAPEIEVRSALLTGEKKIEELAPADRDSLLGPDTIPTLKAEALQLHADENDVLNLAAQKNIKALQDGILERTGAKDWESLSRDLGPDKIRQLYIKDVGDKEIQNIAKEGLDNGDYRNLTRLEGFWLKYMSHPTLTNDILDKRLGTSLGIEKDNSSRKAIEAQLAFSPQSLIVSKEALRLTPEESTNIVREIESGRPASEGALRWRDIFGDVRTSANKLGQQIPERENYVPQMRLPLPDYQTAIRKRADLLGVDDIIRSGDNPQDLASLREGREFLSEVSRALGDKPINTAADLEKGLANIYSDNGFLLHKMNFSAAVGKVRDTEMPEFIRDTNLVSLYTRWTNGVTKEYALNSYLGEVQRATKLAAHLGDNNTLGILADHADYITGEKQDYFSEAGAAALKQFRMANKRVENGSTGIDKTFLESKGELSDLLYTKGLTSNLYANVLSTPHALVQHFMSPLFSAINDQGIDTAAKLWFKSMGDLSKLLVQGEEITLRPHLAAMLGREAGEKLVTRSPELVAFNEGLMGPQWRLDLNPKYLENKRNALVAGLGDVIGASNKALLSGLELGIKGGRITTALIGRNMANLFRDQPAMVDQLIKSPSYRTELKDMLARGQNGQEFGALVGQYLNSHGMLNFDKLNVSGFGRAVGPFFRQFSNFPSYAAGRVVQPLYDKGLVAGSQDIASAFLTPLAAYAAIDKLSGEDQSPRMQAIVGHKGLKGFSQADALLGIWQGHALGIQHSPLLSAGASTAQAGFQAGKALVNKEDPKEPIYKWMNGLANTFGPGVGWIHLLADTAPAILKNEEPDKTETLPQKVRRITK